MASEVYQRAIDAHQAMERAADEEARRWAEMRVLIRQMTPAQRRAFAQATDQDTENI